MSNIKQAFVSRYGDRGLLVEIDCVQLEVFALAEITQDPVLIAELNSGVDIHTMNAAMWLKKPEKLVTPEERKKAKIMTFQLTYGAGAKRMSEDLGISHDAAQEFIDAFLDKYNKIGEFHEFVKTISNCMSSTVEPYNKQHVYNPFAFGLTVPTDRHYTLTYRQSEYGRKDWKLSPTEMKNYPVQGFATGDIVPLILNAILEELDNHPTEDYSIWSKGNCLFINTIHDSGMFDCHEDHLGYLLLAVENVFTNLPQIFKELFDYDLKLNYSYSVKFGPNWKEVIEINRKDCKEIIL